MSEREDVFEFCDSCGVEVPVDYYRCDECVEAGGPVIEQCTYNPATHRLVPRDAVVLEREVVLDCKIELIGYRHTMYGERKQHVGELIARLRSALASQSELASAQGNEEGSDG